MNADIVEIAAMRRAIALSALGLSSTSPNPPVGCVILDSSGRPVSEGYHRRKGESHAEAIALAAAGGSATGGTAVVTLEPCNHYGRTPPCHQALIDAGISRVLVAVPDPTSRGIGGIARLREVGIEVEVGVLAEEALVVLGPWLTGLNTARPRIVWVCDATSGDPRQASDEIVGEAGLRFQVDAVVYPDGHVEEGTEKAHGVEAFVLPSHVPIAKPADTLSSLYRAGARTVLLHGGPALADPFVALQLVDEVHMFIAANGSSPALVPSQQVLAALSELRMQSVRKLSAGVLVVSTPLVDGKIT